MDFCKCGCGELVKANYKRGHGRRGRRNTPEHNLALIKANQRGRILLCDFCHMPIYRRFRHRAIHNFCSLQCRFKWQVGKPLSKETRRKAAEGRKGHLLSETTRRKIGLANAGKKNGCYGRQYSPKEREQRRIWAKQFWADSVMADSCVASMLKAVVKKPNKAESLIIDLINRYNLPFKYTGNGEVVFGRMNPDFININGEKVVLEVFGDYWHSEKKIRSWKETELGRILAYKSFGFDCIVLWEHEIKTLTDDELVKKMMHLTTPAVKENRAGARGRAV